MWNTLNSFPFLKEKNHKRGIHMHVFLPCYLLFWGIFVSFHVFVFCEHVKCR